ncbi:hypothetical protein DFH84_000006 [Clostridium saccharobutylicum]|nr:hypothetical protein [Clostridium saccharobutylicum]MBA8899116.1 hypothetical protein [Clostridium saccharobutylicum]NOV73537.1 hypothetical protein [Clostridium saccharobutylicum]NOV78046.1 hypothetical protein [Clostridium saccharobutylicum]NOW08117.1 hypothetical protein [Clostridium saccharobutylicum]
MRAIFLRGVMENRLVNGFAVYLIVPQMRVKDDKQKEKY